MTVQGTHRAKPATRPVKNCTIGLHERPAVIAVDENGVATGTCRHCQCRLKRLPWSRQWFCVDRMG